MKYIGSKFGHYYFQNKENNIYEMSTLSDEVFFCCNSSNDTHDFEDEGYKAKDVVNSIKKFDLILIRLNFLLKQEKLKFNYAGSMHGNKYYLDEYNNVYGFNSKKPKEVHFCGLRRSKTKRIEDLKNAGLLDFKSKVDKLTSFDLKNMETFEKPKYYKNKNRR